MNKSDLKIGYVVRYRNGALRMVMPVEESDFAFVGEDGSWMGFKNYDNQLMCDSSNREFDIVEVYGFSSCTPYVLKTKTSNRKLLWERDNKKEMTI